MLLGIIELVALLQLELFLVCNAVSVPISLVWRIPVIL
jgi:hypothetical protein